MRIEYLMDVFSRCCLENFKDIYRIYKNNYLYTHI